MIFFSFFVGASVLRDLLEPASSPHPSFGVLTSPSGVRGMGPFVDFTPGQIAAYNREGARQGLQGSSVAPPG